MKLKIGVSGDVASFSEAAAHVYAKRSLPQQEYIVDYLIDMQGVLAAIEDGTIDIGVFPVVNSRGGLVRMAFDAMGKYRFKIIDELPFEVHQCLMTKADINSDKITTIISHPQALAQCKHYLNKHFKHAKLVEWQDTAKAANELSQDLLQDYGDGIAVIAPERAAHVYGLQLISKHIEDEQPNITTFIIVTQHGAL